jgi:hypothetical protein
MADRGRAAAQGATGREALMRCRGCKAGALCAWNQRCARACCGDADCPEGQACHVLHGQLGTIGGCL